MRNHNRNPEKGNAGAGFGSIWFWSVEVRWLASAFGRVLMVEVECSVGLRAMFEVRV